MADAYLRDGDSKSARNILQLARGLVLEYPEPALVWRVHLLNGSIHAEEGRWSDAADAWEQAIASFESALHGAAWRGMTADLSTLALPMEPASTLAALPGVLMRGAGKDARNQTSNALSALSAARWVQQWRLAPGQAGNLRNRSNKCRGASGQKSPYADGIFRRSIDRSLGHRRTSRRGPGLSRSHDGTRNTGLRDSDPARLIIFRHRSGKSSCRRRSAHCYYVEDDKTHPGCLFRVRHHAIMGFLVVQISRN